MVVSRKAREGGAPSVSPPTTGATPKANKRTSMRSKFAKKSARGTEHRDSGLTAGSPPVPSSASSLSTPSMQPPRAEAHRRSAADDDEADVQQRIRKAVKQQRRSTITAVATREQPSERRGIKQTVPRKGGSRKRSGRHGTTSTLLPTRSPAEERMAVAQEELQLFERVQRVPEFCADPFGSVMQHLTSSMTSLQPLTPDVGRIPREIA